MRQLTRELLTMEYLCRFKSRFDPTYVYLANVHPETPRNYCGQLTLRNQLVPLDAVTMPMFVNVRVSHLVLREVGGKIREL
jgi:hypothetical protein